MEKGSFQLKDVRLTDIGTWEVSLPCFLYL